MSLLKYEQDLCLRTNDFDTYDRLKTEAVLEIFQDIAGEHANMLGIGFKASFEKGFYWILVRNKIEILKNPIPLTKLKLATWPHPKGRVDCNREYALYDLNGDIIARGLSKWVIISTETRRLMRTDKITYANDDDTYPENYYTDIAKVIVPDFSLFNKVLSHAVTKNDIDHNGHMNNSKYAALIFNTIQDDYFITSLEIEYVHEVKYKEILDVYMYEDDEFIYHIGMSGENRVFVSKSKRGEVK